jgi:uncharacterized membrane protein
MHELQSAPAPTLPTRTELENAYQSVQKKLSLGVKLTHISYLLLIVLITGFNFQVKENGVGLWLFKIIPLLIFIPGFIKKHYRTYSWLCFAILFYFIWMVPLAMGRGTLGDWALLNLTVIIFIAAMMTSRWLQQASYLQWQINNTPTPAL